MPQPVLNSKQMAAVVTGLRDQGAEVALVAGNRYKIHFNGHMVSISLGSSDKQQLQGGRSKLRTMGLSWPLDPPPKARKPKPVKATPVSQAAPPVVHTPEFSAATKPPPTPKQTDILDKELEQLLRKPAPVPKVKAPMAIKYKPRKSEEVAEWIDLTPELAESFLAHNTSNRTIRSLLVDAYARDMAEGRWRVTGEAIKFDVDDNLVDGQHRLWAVARSGVTIKVLLVLGLDPEVREVVDTGARRSAGDALGFAGVPKYRAMLAGAARIALARDDGYWQTALDARNPSYTNSEVVAFVHDNPNLVEWAETASKTYGPINTMPSAWLYCLWELAKVDNEEAAEFAWSLAEYRTEGVGDARYALLASLKTAKATRGRTMRNPETLYLVFRAWNAWRLSQPAHKFSTTGKGAAGGSPIPKPV